MGLVALVRSWRRTRRGSAYVSDVKADPGGRVNLTLEHTQPPGVDAVPLAGDYAVTVSLPQSGRHAAVGYVDPKNQGTAQQGEYRAYSRGSDGSVKAQVHLKADGSVVLSNSAGSVTLSADGAILAQNDGGAFELGSDGTIDLNGVTIDPSGAVVVPESLVLAGVEHATHIHIQPNDSNGDTQQPVGPPIPGGA